MAHICSLFKPRSHCSLGQSYRGFANSWKVKLALKQENKAIFCSASMRMSNTHILFQGRCLKLNSFLKSFLTFSFRSCARSFRSPCNGSPADIRHPALRGKFIIDQFSIIDLSSNRGQRPQLCQFFEGYPLRSNLNKKTWIGPRGW